MKLYRIAHQDIAYRLRTHPEAGYVLSEYGPFFSVFESVASAILESHLYRETRAMPPTMRLVEYELPAGCHIAVYAEPIFAASGAYFEGELGHAARLFLEGNCALAASFCSIYWREQLNFLINPRHPQFEELIITNIFPCT